MLRLPPPGRRKTASDLPPIFLPARYDAADALQSADVIPDLPKTSGWRRNAPFRLGDLEVLPASGELRSRRGTQRLRPLLMDILVRLAAEPGEVVRRETLLEDVWPRRMVNDEVLSRAIAELRTALGDDARGARYIETLPKLGYRLVAPVQEIAAEAATPAEPVAANDPAPRPARRWLALAVAAVAIAAIAGAAAWMQRSRPPDLAAIEARLKTARPFTSDPGIELAPRFSPDGSRVAFSLAGEGEARVVVQNVDGSMRQFVGGLEGHVRLAPVFFPDGRHIAYWKNADGACAIVRHDLETGVEAVLLDCALRPRARFDLSADGRWLVFAGAQRPQFPTALWLLEVGAAKPPVQVTSPEPGHGEDLFPRFSPDGRRIAFFRGNESHRTPWIVSRDDPSDARAAAKLEGLSYGAAWLGNDGPLVAAGDWLGFRALNWIDLRGGPARLLGARGARFPDVGPHGEIVYEMATYTCNLWRLDPAGGIAKAPLWSSTRYSSQPEIAPDGRRVAFASNRDGVDAIYVGELDGGARRIAFGDDVRYGSPHWSRDGRFVYATRQTQPGGGAAPIDEAVRIPAGGGPAEVLAALGRKVGDLAEGEDGKLYWGELSGHAMRLARAPVADLARAERLPLPLVNQFKVAGGRLVFAQPQLTALTQCSLDTLACAPVADLELRDPEPYHWAVTSRSIFLRVRDTDGKPRLARYDFASRRLEQSWAPGPSGAGQSVAVTPDESMVIMAREDPPAVDLMIAR